jgi:DNA/RNA endonuclease YhcR with UshA esterase domain
VKVVALVLATAGLAVLWMVATRAEVPIVAIGQAGATMNLAYVRLEGRCTRGPSYDTQTGTLSFWIADGTGDLRVASYAPESRALIEADRVPALGDRVSVAGTLRIREDFRSLTVNVPEHVMVFRAEAIERTIGAIWPEDEYQRVRVSGQVRDTFEPYRGLTLITLRDQTGAIDVAVSEDLVRLSGVRPAVKVGQSVAVTAAVSLYDEIPQLVPASTTDVVPLAHDVPTAVRRAVADLVRSDLGRWVAVRGTVVDVDTFSEGLKLIVDDGSGAITVVLWQNVYSGLPGRLGPEVGAEVEVQGKLSEYRAELEVVPALATDVEIVGAAQTARKSSIGALTTDDVGRWVTVQGTLGAPQTFSAGVKFALADGTGRITLLLWDEVYEIAPEGLSHGAEVAVTGPLGVYRGDLEVIPEADGVKVLE